MMRLRSILLPVLMLAVVLTSLGMAMGRGAMAADGQLCAITGPTPIVMAHDGLPLMDAKGDVVTLERPVCFDCVLGALALAPATQIAPILGETSRDLGAAAYALLVPTSWRMGGQGRGPPSTA